MFVREGLTARPDFSEEKKGTGTVVMPRESRAIEARFRSNCLSCKNYILPGQLIVRKQGRWRHQNCVLRTLTPGA